MNSFIAWLLTCLLLGLTYWAGYLVGKADAQRHQEQKDWRRDYEERQKQEEQQRQQEEQT